VEKQAKEEELVDEINIKRTMKEIEDEAREVLNILCEEVLKKRIDMPKMTPPPTPRHYRTPAQSSEEE